MSIAKSLKYPGSPDFSTGAKKMKGSTGTIASAKSKLTVKSKEATKGKSQSGKKSQKKLGYIKMVRSSLPKPAEEDNKEEASETTSTIRSANIVHNNAYTRGIIGAIVAVAPFVILSAFIMA